MAQLIFLFFSGVFAGVALMVGESISTGNGIMPALVAVALYVAAWALHDKA